MKVTLLNPEETKNLFYWWGMASKVCYNTQTNEPERIGKNCLYSNHFSGSRSQYILFQIDDCPRFVIDQAVRHDVGVIKNVQSFRYVDKDCFTYEIPEEIRDNPKLLGEYHIHMENTINLYEQIQSYVLKKGKPQERANEQARYVLPMSTHGSFVIGFTVESLIHYCQMRLCTRTEEKHRELAKKIRQNVLEILPELKARLVPKCQWYMWCDEGKKTCGAYPTRMELKEYIKEMKEN